MSVRSIDKFHKTRLGYLLFGVVELLLSLYLLNLAIGSGDWWEWLLALVFGVGFLQNFGRSAARGKRK